MIRIHRLLLSAGCIVACLLLLEPTAQAHRVNVFCWVDAEEIVCESSFAGGSPVKNGRIEVRAESSGRLLLSGATNAKGRFRFTPPDQASDQAWDLKVISKADMGHKGFWIVRGEEYAETKRSGSDQDGEARAPSRSEAQPAPQRAEQRQPASGGRVSAQEMEQAVSRALRQELAPIRESLAELRQDRITFEDILGGLGYILGLTGIGLYVASRRR